jgi:hypothetical protein
MRESDFYLKVMDRFHDIVETYQKAKEIHQSNNLDVKSKYQMIFSDDIFNKINVDLGMSEHHIDFYAKDGDNQAQRILDDYIQRLDEFVSDLKMVRYYL